MANIVEFIYRLQDRVSGTLEKLEKNTQRVQGQMERTQSKVNSLEASIGRMAVRYMSFTAVIMGAKGFAKLGMDMEQTRAKFEVMLGSVEKGNKMIADINEMANATPFNNADLVKSSELLLSFNYDAQKLLPTLNMLGNVAMGDKNKLAGLTLAFAQMSSTGRLMGQDLLQMINQGFNPLVIISERTGKSMAVLKKEMEAGRISSEMVEEAFRLATSEGGKFHNMMDKMSQTGAGKLSTFIGSLQLKLTELAEKLNPFIVKVMDFGIKIVNNFDSIAKTIWAALLPVRTLVIGLKELFKFFSKNREILIAVTVVLSAYKLLVWQSALALKGWTIASMLQYKWLLLVEKAQMLLNIAMVKNPVLALIAGVSLLVGAFMLLRKRTHEASGEVNKVKYFSDQYFTSEKKGLDDVFKQLEKTNAKSVERNELVDKLIKKYPSLNKQIESELRNTNNLSAAKEVLIQKIMQEAIARGIQSAIQQKADELANAQLEAFQEEQRNTNAIKKFEEKWGQNSYAETMEAYGTGQLYPTDPRLKDLPSSLSKLTSIGRVSKIQKEIEELQGLLKDERLSGNFLGGASSADSDTSISGLTGAGSRPTNITINLRNLVEYLNMYPQTVREGVSNMEDQLIEGLLRVVNSANRIAVR